MTFSVNLVEAIWITLNGVTFGLTLWALWDARVARKDAKESDGTRLKVARGNVRREKARLAIQAIFLTIAIPGVFSENEAELTPLLLLFLSIPLILLVSTILDARERREIMAIEQEQLSHERDESLRVISNQIEDLDQKVEASIEEHHSKGPQT